MSVMLTASDLIISCRQGIFNVQFRTMCSNLEIYMGKYENARKITTEKITNAFWELYCEKTINRITVNEICKHCGIGRGTFYYYFHDVYEVLEMIERVLSEQLDRISDYVRCHKQTMVDFSETLFHFYQSDITKNYINLLVLNRSDPAFAQKYLYTLKMCFLDVCIADGKNYHSSRDKMLVESAATSLIDILLNCICNSDLTLNEINDLIMGLMKNGYYVTLTSRFGIDVLNNPFLYRK